MFHPYLLRNWNEGLLQDHHCGTRYNLRQNQRWGIFILHHSWILIESVFILNFICIFWRSTPFRCHFLQLIPSNLLVLSGKGRMVGDQPEGAPVKGVKRKVIVPLPVLTKSAGSGLRFHPWQKWSIKSFRNLRSQKSHGILRYTLCFFPDDSGVCFNKFIRPLSPEIFCAFFLWESEIGDFGGQTARDSSLKDLPNP